MNLTSRRARTLLALCSAGAVVAGGVTATSAFAVGETLNFGPSATSATILNVDPGSSQVKANSTYGLKVTGATASDTAPLRLQVLTGPSSSMGVLYEDPLANAAPTYGRAYSKASTVLTADAAIGATSITVSSTTGMTTGDFVSITTGTSRPEYRVVTVATSTSLTFTAALLSAHLSGAAVHDYLAPSATTAIATTAAVATDTTVTVAATVTANHWMYIQGDTVAGDEFRKATAYAAGPPKQITVAALSSGHAIGNAVVDLGAMVGMGLTAAPAAGATAISIASSTGLVAGDRIQIDGTVPEVAVVDSLDGGGVIVNLKEPLVAAHPIGSYVLMTEATVAAGTADAKFTPVPVGGSRQIANYTITTNSDNIFLGAMTPGTYTLRFFKDRNGDAAYNSTQDDATPTFTLNVKDVNGATTATTDDWSPSITVPSSVAKGLTVPVSISASDLTTSDTRGTNSATGVNKLGEGIASTLGVAWDGAAVGGIDQVTGAPSFDGTNFTRTSTGTAATTDSPVAVAITGLAATTTTRSVTVSDNLVTAMTAASTDVVGSAKFTDATDAVAVKTGTTSVAYTATVTAPATNNSGKTVYFTLTPGTNTPTLSSADGTLFSSNASTGVKVYSAVTSSTGVATLTVTSGTTTAGTTYTVAPATNGAAVTNPTLTATYADAAASTFTLTTPTASMSPTVGGSVALAGTLNDQFGSTFQPASTATQQVTVTIDQNNSSYSSADVTGYGTLSGGAFTYTYTPTTAATVGRQDVVQFAYGSVTDSTNSVYWTTATAASSVTISAPVSAATPEQQKATVATLTAPNDAGTAVTGTVLDSSNAGLAYKSVTLTGRSGVYFSTVDTPVLVTTTDNLVTSLAVAANASGAYTGYAFFAKAGAATITVTSGTATTTVNVVVTQSSDPYTVTAAAGAVEPGGTSVVTGTVLNGFGFPVSAAEVDLSLGTSTIATLGDTSPTTNADGVWSTTLTGASSGSGTATLTASLHGRSRNATADATWLTKAGLTIAAYLPDHGDDHG